MESQKKTTAQKGLVAGEPHQTLGHWQLAEDKQNDCLPCCVATGKVGLSAEQQQHKSCSEHLGTQLLLEVLGQARWATGGSSPSVAMCIAVKRKKRNTTFLSLSPPSPALTPLVCFCRLLLSSLLSNRSCDVSAFFCTFLQSSVVSVLSSCRKRDNGVAKNCYLVCRFKRDCRNLQP